MHVSPFVLNILLFLIDAEGAVAVALSICRLFLLLLLLLLFVVVPVAESTCTTTIYTFFSPTYIPPNMSSCLSSLAVGKSALLTRFSENVFLPSYTSTIGIDFNSRMIRVGRAICKLEIWDTAGQERFSTITANYYRGAQGALLVYDICKYNRTR